MSGGSFDYAYAVYDLQDLVSKRGNLAALAETLEKYPGTEAAIAATKAMLARVEVLDNLARNSIPEELRAVWKAVEWNWSGDWGVDAVHEAVAAFNASARAAELVAPIRLARGALVHLPGGPDAWPALVAIVAGAVRAALDEQAAQGRSDGPEVAT